MSQMPSKVNVSVAVPNKSKKTFTQQHLTTVGFMKPRPIFCREYIPNRDMKVNVNSFLRANPLPVPVIGKCKVFNRAFYVPFRTVFPAWDEFYTSTVFPFNNGNAIPGSVPTITNSAFVDFFVNSVSAHDPLLSVGTNANCDISVHDHNGTAYYLFTDLGIDAMTIIESLGYKINWRSDDSFVHSALPLLCYAKVICDWYYPSAYVGDSVFQLVNKLFQNPINNLQLDVTELTAIFQCILNPCCYNPDYLVNAFDSPIGPNSLTYERDIRISDITNNAGINYNTQVANNPTSGSNTTPTNGTPFTGYINNSNNFVGGSSVLTQYVIDSIKTLTDYTRRHALSGVRAIDRYLSELGINLSDQIMKRSMYLGSQDFDMEFYDVFSHADTVNGNNGAQLGAYAGKGNGFSGNKEFSFENGQEFGMFIIVNSLMPVIGYYQGQHRETMHVNCLDFYHGDFDHMAIQPISCREVYVTQEAIAAVAQNTLNSTIFGYAPKYIEYNTPMDLQTGLFRVKTQKGLLPLYSLMRDLSWYENGTVNAMKHNIGFVVGNDSSQYDRIFYNALNHFQFIAAHNFDVTYFDSTLPAYDTYKFDESNKEIQLEINGSKLN